MFSRKAYRIWIALLVLLFLAGVAIIISGMAEYGRGFHLPRGGESAGICIRIMRV